MTKKHFIEIARILSATGASEATIFAMARYFATQNQYFDAERFAEACKKSGTLEIVKEK
jgi:hypothetical protein